MTLTLTCDREGKYSKSVISHLKCSVYFGGFPYFYQVAAADNDSDAY